MALQEEADTDSDDLGEILQTMTRKKDKAKA